MRPTSERPMARAPYAVTPSSARHADGACLRARDRATFGRLAARDHGDVRERCESDAIEPFRYVGVRGLDSERPVRRERGLESRVEELADREERRVGTRVAQERGQVVQLSRKHRDAKARLSNSLRQSATT